MTKIIKDEELINKFFSRAANYPDARYCWIFPGHVNSKGFVYATFQKKYMPAHRVAYMLACGEVPEKTYVSHYCSSHNCINPGHLYLRPIDMSLEERLKRHTNNFGVSGVCWEWVGHKNKQGYGSLTVYNETYRATHISYINFKGPIPEGMIICHSCDNPSCVNPEHLWAGTYKDNSQDRDVKKRNQDTRGEKNPLSRLKEEDILEIRRMSKNGWLGTEIAHFYQMHPNHIRDIILKKSWKHIL